MHAGMFFGLLRLMIKTRMVKIYWYSHGNHRFWSSMQEIISRLNSTMRQSLFSFTKRASNNPSETINKIVCTTVGMLFRYSKTGTTGSNLLVVHIRQLNSLAKNQNKQAIRSSKMFLSPEKRGFALIIGCSKIAVMSRNPIYKNFVINKGTRLNNARGIKIVIVVTYYRFSRINKIVYLYLYKSYMKLKAGFCVLVLLLMGVVNAFAQNNLPCTDTDPDATCPLDTWVIALVIIASAFAAYRLHRKQALFNPRSR
jgi:hypothetical protein